MWHLNGIDGGKIPQKILLSTKHFVIFLGFASIFGNGNCSSPCPSVPNSKELQLPRLKLWRENETVSLLDHPGDKIVDLAAAPISFDDQRQVKIDGVEITCTAPYPVMLVAVTANEKKSEKEEEFQKPSMTNPVLDKFPVNPEPESESESLAKTDKMKDANPSLNMLNTVFETRSILWLNTVRNFSMFACEAIDNPCLRSLAKLVFSFEGKSVDSEEHSTFNFTVRMTENSRQKHPDPSLNSEDDFIPISNNTSSSGDTTIVVVLSVAGFIILILILTLFLFVRRNRKLKHALRDLSDEEVHQFHFGDKTVDPTDNHAAIYALAYDQSLEISPDLIEIDDHEALGHGGWSIVRPGVLQPNSNLNDNASGNKTSYVLEDLSFLRVEEIPADNTEITALAYDQSLEIPPDSIEIDDDSPVLGFGAFGIVRRGALKSNLNLNSNSNGSGSETGENSQVPVTVAIKIPRANVTTKDFISFLCEIKIMSFVQSHENILRILGASTINIQIRRALIVLELCELGNLKNFLTKFLSDPNHAFKNEFPRFRFPRLGQINFSGAAGDADSWNLLPESERLETLDLLNFSLGIANGMNFLAEKKVIHGDLAARNVLLTQNREVKISDFGFSTQLKNFETDTNTNPCKIPWRWFPLEALAHQKFSLKSDCWSYGILLYEIFSMGEDPYRRFDHFEPNFVNWLRHGFRPEQPYFANNDIYNLMTECWRNDPHERPTFAEICQKILDLSVEFFGPKLHLI